MSILNVANSGLNAFQRALSVTGNNIANATTQGYSRQTVQFMPNLSQRYAGSYIGTGVSVASILRNSDQFARMQVRNTLTARSQYEVFFQQAGQIDKLLSQGETTLSTSMQSFFDGINQLNNAPESISARNVFLQQSQLLVNQFQSLQHHLDEYQHNSKVQISEAVAQVNQITKDIAAVNKQLLGNPNASNLLDQRDELLRQLSQFVEVSSIDQSDGTLTVSIANGESLVTGPAQRDLAVSSQGNGLTTTILVGTGAGQIDITKKLTSGKLGGLLQYETDVIGQSSQLIGQMAIGLAQKFNTQHQLGMDLNSQVGKAFFTDYNTTQKQLNRAFSMSTNTGTGVLSVNISDIAQTQLSDYELVVTDTATNEVRLLRKSDGSTSILNWASSPPAPPAGQLVIDGMTINVDDISNLSNNDRFILAPTRGAARDLALQISDIREIALAAPVKTDASLNNTGSGKISLGTIFNTTGINKQYRIDFISATQYNLVNLTDSTSTGPITFTPDSNNTLSIPDSSSPAYTIILAGVPKTGDQFTAEYNIGGTGDNRNGLSLSLTQQSKMFSNSSETIFDRYSNLLSQVGSQTYQAKMRLDSAEILHQQAEDFQDSKSGVNLDEEAGDLLRFKQAYEAAGKLLQVANQMMNILFEVMR
ncbi:MAG: flagellar hook-associated protein FlgK [Legionella sp.]|nr:MAG: flagellar hook-associated protein FlgK [Legionella sp.]